MLFTKQGYTFFKGSSTVLPSVKSFENPSKVESKNQMKSSSKNACKPKRSVLSVMTGKTDFSSVQNIFFRYGHKHNLKFVLPRKDRHFGHPRMFNDRMLHRKPMFTQHNQSLFSIRDNSTTHDAYNHEKMKSIMPVGTIFVTILRDPVFSIESFPSFNDLKSVRRNKSAIHLERFVSASRNKSAHQLDRGRFDTPERNAMSFKLGLDEKHFDNLQMIKKFINTIDSQFHLVMISDRLEESLIHLKHRLCWTLDDVIVFRHNVQNASLLHNVSTDLKQKIRSFNNADELLYKHFDAKLTRQTEVFGKRKMKEQIISLQHATNLMYDKCVNKEVPMKNFKLLNLHGPGNQVPTSMLKNKMDKTCKFLTISQGSENAVLGLRANMANTKAWNN